MERDGYQLRYSSEHRESVYDRERREQKAQKILAVLEDHFGAALRSQTVLDIGCSAGTISALIGERVRRLTGVDIDEEAVQYARAEHGAEGLRFEVGDAMALSFGEASFDVVLCNHIYEHVPDARRLLAEIHRVLKPGGVCYFAAGNRLKWMEDHYRLPLLSVIPKPLAHLWLRCTGRAERYYEKHLTCWQLRRLVEPFERIDYTRRIVEQPERFRATEMLRSGTLQQRLALAVLRFAYWLAPTYIWLLRKGRRISPQKG
ncbi:MAG: class I SAM-dependent methyltransferase [Deltaproteobacteria bacterium]|nr:class I SAM-dependent methyltransferase [Deltaproteobacteria bacterium]